MSRRGRRAALVLGGLALLGCDSAAVKKCHGDMAISQKAITEMDQKDIEGVKKVLGTIRTALDSCKEARRRDEVTDLEEAERNVAAHVQALEKRAARGALEKLTPEQIEKLKKEGDPSCPRGHVHGLGADTSVVIKCTGPQLAEMSQAGVEDYFDKRGFLVRVQDTPRLLRAEYGAELFVFRYPDGTKKSAPSCVSVVAPPNVPWKETILRATGVDPNRIEEGKPLATKPPLAFRLEGPETGRIVHIGSCEGVSGVPPLATAP